METIDPRIFIKKLAPDQLGMFEPLSGLMLLNISQNELEALGNRWMSGQSTEFDVAIIRTINHETYHFAQAAASGYVYHRQCRLFAVFNSSEPMPEVGLDEEIQSMIDAARESAGDDPKLKRRVERMVAVLEGHHQLAILESRAAAGDHSLIGALMPSFFVNIKELSEAERVTNADGLSILGVLEGSAVVHTQLLMQPDGDAAPYIEAELTTLPHVYRELYDLTVARVGGRALELLLPAVALALRYAQPHNAYVPLLMLLADSALGEAITAGRDLQSRLPEITAAGSLFGTAIALRQQHEGYRIYDSILDKLKTAHWGIDSYDLLAQPAVMHAIGSFPMGIVTSDGYSGSLDKLELAARMVLMGAVLRSQSRRRAERKFREFQVEWAREVIGQVY